MAASISCRNEYSVGQSCRYRRTARRPEMASSRSIRASARHHATPTGWASRYIGIVVLGGVAPVPPAWITAGRTIKGWNGIDWRGKPKPVWADRPPPAAAAIVNAMIPAASAPAILVEPHVMAVIGSRYGRTWAGAVIDRARQSSMRADIALRFAGAAIGLCRTGCRYQTEHSQTGDDYCSHRTALLLIERTSAQQIDFDCDQALSF